MGKIVLFLTVFFYSSLTLGGMKCDSELTEDKATQIVKKFWQKNSDQDFPGNQVKFFRDSKTCRYIYSLINPDDFHANATFVINDNGVVVAAPSNVFKCADMSLTEDYFASKIIELRKKYPQEFPLPERYKVSFKNFNCKYTYIEYNQDGDEFYSAINTFIFDYMGDLYDYFVHQKESSEVMGEYRARLFEQLLKSSNCEKPLTQKDAEAAVTMFRHQNRQIPTTYSQHEIGFLPYPGGNCYFTYVEHKIPKTMRNKLIFVLNKRAEVVDFLPEEFTDKPTFSCSSKALGESFFQVKLAELRETKSSKSLPDSFSPQTTELSKLRCMYVYKEIPSNSKEKYRNEFYFDYNGELIKAQKDLIKK